MNTRGEPEFVTELGSPWVRLVPASTEVVESGEGEPIKPWPVQFRDLLLQAKAAMVKMEKHHRFHHDKDGTLIVQDPVVWDGMCAIDAALEMLPAEEDDSQLP